MIRKAAILSALVGLAMLGGCAQLGSLVSEVTVAATSATPTQATTLAEAEQAATLAEQALDLYVRTGNPSQAVLSELQILVPAIHNSLVKVEQANSAGNSALAATALAAFNEALTAYQTYAANNGVPQ